MWQIRSVCFSGWAMLNCSRCTRCFLSLSGQLLSNLQHWPKPTYLGPSSSSKCGSVRGYVWVCCYGDISGWVIGTFVLKSNLFKVLKVLSDLFKFWSTHNRAKTIQRNIDTVQCKRSIQCWIHCLEFRFSTLLQRGSLKYIRLVLHLSFLPAWRTK